MTYITDDDLGDLALTYTRRYPARRSARRPGETLTSHGLKPIDHTPVTGERVWVYATGRIRPAVAVKMGRKNLKVYHSTPTTIETHAPHGADFLRRYGVKAKSIPLGDVYQERV